MRASGSKRGGDAGAFCVYGVLVDIVALKHGTAVTPAVWSQLHKKKKDTWLFYANRREKKKCLQEGLVFCSCVAQEGV